MTITLPTPTEYARMSWSARQAAVTRLRQLQRGATSVAIEQARFILADIPADPPLVCAARREALLAEASHFDVRGRTYKQQTTIGDAA